MQQRGSTSQLMKKGIPTVSMRCALYLLSCEVVNGSVIIKLDVLFAYNF